MSARKQEGRSSSGNHSRIKLTFMPFPSPNEAGGRILSSFATKDESPLSNNFIVFCLAIRPKLSANN